MSALAMKAKIREYYEGLGSDVAEFLAVQLVDKGGFAPLFLKLQIPDPGAARESDRYAALYAHVRKVGRRRFMEEMGGLSADFSLEAQSHDGGRQQRLRILEESLRRKARNSATGPLQPPYGPRREEGTSAATSVAETSPARPASPVAGSSTPTDGLTPPLATPTPTPPAPSPAPVPAPVPNLKAREAKARAPRGPLQPAAPPPPGAPTTPAWDPERPYDPKGSWPEVERRSGVERRKGKDRRVAVELIYKNRRYGKDRRMSGERRKNWPKGGFRPEDESGH
jgi:hypothetical protein